MKKIIVIIFALLLLVVSVSSCGKKECMLCDGTGYDRCLNSKGLKCSYSCYLCGGTGSMTCMRCDGTGIEPQK